MQALNARERVACVYECQQSDIQKQRLDAVYKRLGAQVPDMKQPTSIHGTLSFFIAINATKVPQLLEVSKAFKAIMGGAHPHHMISTKDLDSTTIKKILECEEIFNQAHSMMTNIDKASEIKVASMVFQKTPPGVSPIVITSAWPQSNNECSSLLQTS
jgi:hypothetical protein